MGGALVLCQSEPVLNDGQGGGEQSKEAVIDNVRKRFVEKVITQHEDDGNHFDSLEHTSVGKPCIG